MLSICRYRVILALKGPVVRCSRFRTHSSLPRQLCGRRRTRAANPSPMVPGCSHIAIRRFNTQFNDPHNVPMRFVCVPFVRWTTILITSGATRTGVSMRPCSRTRCGRGGTSAPSATTQRSSRIRCVTAAAAVRCCIVTLCVCAVTCGEFFPSSRSGRGFFIPSRSFVLRYFEVVFHLIEICCFLSRAFVLIVSPVIVSTLRPLYLFPQASSVSTRLTCARALCSPITRA